MYYENDYQHLVKEINFDKFEETNESEYDHKIYERSFSGRITKARYKALDCFCRSHSFSTHCSCEYDCCGHLVYQRCSFTYKHNQVTIRLTQSFNY